MKIVNRNTFMELPSGTLFSEWDPCIFGPLMIKGESLETDFYEQQIADAIASQDSGQFFDLCFKSQSEGISIGMDFSCESRNGMFEPDQLFAVWERPDVEALIARLSAALLAVNTAWPK